MQRYPPLEDLPWGNSDRDWLRSGSARERYAVPFRGELNIWPPPAVSPAALYAVWLWSSNTGDWSYIQDNWDKANEIFKKLTEDGIHYYADLAGYIGYARLAKGLGKDTEYQNALQAGQTTLDSLPGFASFVDQANQTFLDPRDEKTGWSAPVFFGLTLEVGQILRDTAGTEAAQYLEKLESGNGLRWWYITRVGIHGEIGESSYLSPMAAWSHFLAHAYITGESQEQLIAWLDRPWAAGDLYSVQKIVAALQSISSLPGRNFHRHGR
jgi:hypothetical protein